jgi:hypothetical protein
METLDYALGYAEFVLVPLSIGWLVLACLRPKPRRLRYALAFALLLAVTVAQPVGLVATRQDGPPPHGARRSPSGMNVARLFGVPTTPFVLYRRGSAVRGFENAPRATLRARSWFWLPILGNASKIADICANDIFTPCWEPSEDRTAPSPYANTLRLVEVNGTQWVSISNPFHAKYPAGEVPAAVTWRLHLGLASPAGALFWLVIAGLATASLRRR